MITFFGSLDSNDWVAAFTGVLLLVTGVQAWIGIRANQHFRVTERAYIKMSHLPPGITWDSNTSAAFKISIEITNKGQTPGEITDLVTNAVLAPPGMIITNLPPYVPHTLPQQTKAFLMPGDPIYQHQTLHIGPQERPLVSSGTQIMLVYGYVDYKDQFGVRHRGGYGRAYTPQVVANNLSFPDSGKFNYDRERVRGEGIDWDT